jgi:hypothetical protein
MRRSAKAATAAPVRTPAERCDDIESEFLGIWLGLGRLREKLLALTARNSTEPCPRCSSH